MPKASNKIKELINSVNSETNVIKGNLVVKPGTGKFITDKNGTPKGNYVNNINEAVKRLDNNGKVNLAFNKFTESVDVKRNDGSWSPLNDNDLTAIQSMIETHFDFTPSTKGLLDGGIELYAKSHPFNPIMNWINSKPWDRKPRVNKLLSDYLGADDDAYSEMVSRKLCLGAISRLLHPGIKFELMPILYGHQGLGKSTLVEKLFGYSGYFTDNLNNMNASDNNTILTLLRAWGVEISELSAIGKTKIEDVKGFLSSANPTYRELYNRRPSVFHNHCVFVGTTNNGDILADETGNRRFLPVCCGKNKAPKDIFKLSKDTVQQIWAESLFRYRKYCSDNKKRNQVSPDEIYLTTSQDNLANKYRQQFRAFDPIEAAIRTFLSIKVPENWSKLEIGKKSQYCYDVMHDYDLQNDGFDTSDFMPMKIVTMREILILALHERPRNIIRLSRGNIGRKVDLAMHHTTWKRKRINVNGHRIRAFVKTSNK